MALDLARRQRELSAGASAASVTPMPARATLNGNATTRVVRLSKDHLERQRVLHAGSDENVSRAYKMLRTQVLQRMRQHGFQTLAIVSPTPADGKSLTAANLAISISQDSNHTALLVDLDLKRPAVQGLFDLRAEHGVEEYLAGQCALPQALVRPEQYERLVLMPAHAPVAGSSELLSSARLRELVGELKARYADRIILFDLPPLLPSDDALAFLPVADAALVVASEGRTRRDDLLRALELMRNTTVVGTVLNRSSESSSGVY